MKFIFWSVLLVLNSFLLLSQNLVPNPSFENYKNRPTKTLSDHELDELLYDWESPTKASPDFYVFFENPLVRGNYENINLSEQQAFEGNVFVGLLLQIYFGESISLDHINYREYIQAKLLKPLKKGHKYYASIYYKLSERSTNAIDGLGICFSKDKIQSLSYLLTYKPQISNRDGNIMTNCDWRKLEGYVLPENEMNFITIGNFKRYNAIHFEEIQPKDSVSTPYAYYLIDKIEVYEVEMSDFRLDTISHTRIIQTDNQNNKNQTDSLIPRIELAKNDTIILSDILFEFGKANLLPKYFDEINKIVDYLHSSQNIFVTIEGHTDSIGNNIVNLKLSKDRADAIAVFLRNNGIDTLRISTFGYGETRPISNNGTDKERARNRRVEIIFKIK